MKITPLELIDPNENVGVVDRRLVKRPMLEISESIVIQGFEYRILALAFSRNTDNHKYIHLKFGNKIYFYDDTKAAGWMSLLQGFPSSTDQCEMVILRKIFRTEDKNQTSPTMM